MNILEIKKLPVNTLGQPLQNLVFVGANLCVRPQNPLQSEFFTKYQSDPLLSLSFIISNPCSYLLRNPKKMKSRYLLAIPILASSLSANAEVILDGTLGRSGALPGPDYLIGADLGRQHGGNLFHSFKDFNLNRFESATFSGPNSINNVINRVTGGNPSSIDGLIRSTIPANMYFLNPNGIIFGPNARLDVQGSFHASTADYLRFGNGGRFDARNPSESLLTVAPIESFGFLNGPIAPISVQGHGEVSQDLETGLSVPEGQTLSLIGGKIDIRAGTFFKTVTIDDEGNGSTEITRLPILAAPSGRINLASVASQGEVKLGGDFVDISSFSQLADIHIKENSLLKTSGENGGSIFIRGGQFVVDNSMIESKTLGSQDGGMINLRANTIFLTNGATISSNTEDSGRGADIDVRATDSITIAGENTDHTKESAIIAKSVREGLVINNSGNAGDIYLEAKNIEVKDGGGISTSTLSEGNAGNLTINASETILVTGEGKRWEKIKASWDGSYIASATFNKTKNAGNAGKILIKAKNISLTDGSYIYSSTEGKGKGGQVTLKADETVSFSGEKNSSGYPSRINIDTQLNEGGDAANLLIDAENILFQDSTYIDSTTSGKGKGGSIKIQASDKITFSDSSSIRGYANGKGHAGSISIDANEIFLDEGFIGSDTFGEGNAGSILINTKHLFFSSSTNKRSNISSSTAGRGDAGKVKIYATGTIIVAGASNQTGGWASFIGSLSVPKSPNKTSGAGGDIWIEAQELIVKDGGQISVASIAFPNTSSGQGGNITILVSGPVILSGVNPYGENEQGFGAGIYARSFGENAGSAGTIELSAGSLTILDGAVIESSTNNTKPSGNIKIDITGLVHISGDASQSGLLELASRQEEYIRKFSPRTYNQSTSGIYASSNSPLEQAGTGGNIELTAQNLTMTDKGTISTTSAGGGQAGTITITINKLQLDNTAKIASESQFTNTFEQETNQFVNSGDRVEIADEGNGKARTRFVLNDNSLITITPPIDTVANLAELDKLGNNLANGQVIEVTDIGNRESARFLYYNNNWINLEAGQIHKVANVSELDQLQYAQTGNITHVTRNAQTASFIYSGKEWLPINRNGEQRTVSNYSELEQLSAQNGDVVVVENTEKNQRFLYVNDKWIEPARGGDAGTLTITARDGIRLSSDSAITTESISAGGGGLTIKTDGLLYLTNSNVTTSVEEGIGQGGGINVNTNFIVLENGKIIARAYEGDGGNMNITTTGIYRFGDESKSPIDASSKLGVDGEVVVNSPDSDISGKLFVLSTKMVNAADQLQKPCNSRIAENLSSFTIIPSEGTPNQPDDLLPSGPILFKLKPAKTTKSIKSTTRHLQVAYLRYCKPAPATTKSGAKSSIIPEQLF